MQVALELSVWVGVAGCGWPILASVIMSMTPSLFILEDSAGFSFGGGQHHVAHNINNGVHCAIRIRRGNGGIGGISGAGSECEEATDYAV